MLGDLGLDDMMADSTCIAPWPFASCGHQNGWLLPFFTAVYVLITNILLTNLLIAMFNDTVSLLRYHSLRCIDDAQSTPLFPTCLVRQNSAASAPILEFPEFR